MPVTIFNFIREYALWIMLLFYAVGILGLGAYDKELFAGLTPLILLLSTILIFICHKGGYQNISILLAITFMLGFAVEYIGVHYNILFGSYVYGPTLGIKVLDIPVMIGVNWFLITVSAGYFVQKIFRWAILRIVGAAALMVFTDFWIEPVAQALNYWRWADSYVPATNYFHWFLVSLLMQLAFHLLVRNQTNTLAAAYYIILTVFFILVNIVI